MIEYFSEIDFELTNQSKISGWISDVIDKEGFENGAISYIFSDDAYLLEINSKYLKHSTLTDIISFDYTLDSLISGDIFISTERVQDNAQKFGVEFMDELCRVMIHGILHFCGYKDKTKSEKVVMRSKEDYYLSLRSF